MRIGICVVILLCCVPGMPRAQDFDFDSVPDPSDNCDFVPNLDQADGGSFNSGLADGVGDVCQCGDLSGEGRVDVVDGAVLVRHVGGRAPGPADAFTCSLTGGPWDCDGADLAALRQALAGLGPGVQQVCRAAAGSPGLPGLDAAAGDSITKAFAASCTCNAGLCGLSGLLCLLGMEQPENSWFDGWSGDVWSVHDRYKGLDAGIVADSSAALTGAEMREAPDNFVEQAQSIVALQPDLVTVMLGGNDICSRDCVDPGCANSLYSEEEWRLAVQAGLNQLATGLPVGATVYLVSVPRVQDLRAAGLAKQAADPSDIDCENVWSTFDVCLVATQGGDLNGEPLATRLAAIEERQRRYNEILREEAIAYSTGERVNPQAIEVIAEYVDETTVTVGTQSFGPDDVNGGDCFHPSLQGQNRVAEVVWWSDPRRTGP